MSWTICYSEGSFNIWSNITHSYYWSDWVNEETIRDIFKYNSLTTSDEGISQRIEEAKRLADRVVY